MGLVSMRERAELVNGRIEFLDNAARRRAGATDGAGSRGGDACLERSITVLLVDDHSLVRRGFRRMLEDDPGDRGGGRSRATATRRWNSPANCVPTWW